LRIKMMMHPRFCCSYSTIGTGDCTLLCASKWNTLFIETRTTTVRGGEGVYVSLWSTQEHINSFNSIGETDVHLNCEQSSSFIIANGA